MSSLSGVSIIEGHFVLPREHEHAHPAGPEQPPEAGPGSPATDASASGSPKKSAREVLHLPFAGFIPLMKKNAAGSVAPPSTVLVFVHGPFANRMDCRHIARALAGDGIPVYSFDQRSWGRDWEGPKGHVEDARDLVEDVAAFGRFVMGRHERETGRPRLVLVGHSTGAIVAAAAALAHPTLFAALALLCPCFAPYDSTSAFRKFFSPMLDKVMPTSGLGEAAPEVALLTADPAEQALVEKEREGGVRATRATRMGRLAMACEADGGVAGAGQEGVAGRAGELRAPLFAALAGGDRLVDNAAAQRFVAAAGAGEKAAKVYPGALHALHCEREALRAELAADLAAFCSRAAAVPAPAPA
eukprot:tig00000821_g4518.t1